MKAAKIIQSQNGFELKPYNNKELSNLYGVTWHVFHKWIVSIKDQLGPQVGRLYNIQQVQLIIKMFGTPGKMLKEDEESQSKAA